MGDAPDADTHAKTVAKEILTSAGIKAGLCVQLGCGDGTLAAELAQRARLLVYGLDSNAEAVARARRNLRSRGLYGRVSVEHRGSYKKLPIADNLVNLIVADTFPALLTQGLSLKEMMRVLCPGGMMYLRGEGGKGEALTRDKLQDQFTAAGVTGFEIAEPAGGWARIRKLRPADMDAWTHHNRGADGNPVSHDKLVGVPTGVRWQSGPTWVPGHDERTIKTRVSAGGRLFFVHDDVVDTAKGPRRQRTLVARDAYNGLLLWKREVWGHINRWRTPLVALADRVYAVLPEKNNLLCALDAATGELLRDYSHVGRGFLGFACVGNSLIVRHHQFIRCVDARTGNVKWQTKNTGYCWGKPFVIGNGRLFCTEIFEDKFSEVLALDLATGKQIFRRSTGTWPIPPKRYGQKISLVFYQDGVLVVTERDGGNYGLSAKDGSHLWDYRYRTIRHGGRYSNCFYVNGLVWMHPAAKDTPEIIVLQKAAEAARKEDVDRRRGVWVGVDPKSGKVKKQLLQPKNCSFHHRCYGDVATERFFFFGTMDIVDVKTGQYQHSRITKPACLSGGLMPANGLVYSFTTRCVCYPMVRGVLGLASESSNVDDDRAERFEKGSGWGREVSTPETSAEDEWPTLRHDASRSGTTSSKVPANLKLLYQKQIAISSISPFVTAWRERRSFAVSSPTIAGGTVFVADSDGHRVVALHASNGKERWSYTAGGRIDTPPSIYKGLCLFGSRDGWVYCLRAADGELIWRLRAAPDRRRIMTFAQLESPTPVAGGVLIYNGLAYFAAGRHSETNGGIFVYAVDPFTGKNVWQKQPQGYIGLPDVLAATAEKVCMSSWEFDPDDGQNSGVRWTNTLSRRGRLLGGALGLLGDSWLRNPQPSRREFQHWNYNNVKGQLLAISMDTVFGFSVGFNRVFMGRSSTGQRTNPPEVPEIFAKGKHNWTVDLPKKWQTQMTSILVAGDTLFAGGRLADADAVRYVLRAYSVSDGKLLNEEELVSPPAHDGMAAAGGRLYVSTQDGRLLCFGQE